MLKYINNNMQLGLEYDHKKIIEKYRSLNCPKDVYDPVPAFRSMYENIVMWYIGMSKRRIGKTTNFLLLGMIMNAMYGTHIYYIRQRDDMIAPRNSNRLFDTIIQNKYIDMITDGEYNDVFYRARQWYFCYRSDTGDIVRESPDSFCRMQSVQSAENVKSVLNDPVGDFIIYDEFIGSNVYPREFEDFFNLISTIKRLRRSAKIFLLANTIDMYHIYFKEFCIADEVQKMRAGDKVIITTQIGTKVYVERIEQPAAAKKQDEIDKVLYYGFPNPKLSSITGDDWAIANYQHIPDGKFDYIYNKIYIKYSNKYVRLDIIEHETLGICLYAHWATHTYDDSLILTADERTDPRYIFKTGQGRLDMLFRRLFNTNRVYYATNDVGVFVESYLNYIKRLRYV